MSDSHQFDIYSPAYHEAASESDWGTLTPKKKEERLLEKVKTRNKDKYDKLDLSFPEGIDLNLMRQVIDRFEK